MKLASLSFTGEKKNPDNSLRGFLSLKALIPASYYKKTRSEKK
jgi:hypothetical protein